MDRKKAFLKTPIGTVRIIGTSVGIQEVSFVESHDSVQAEVPSCLADCHQQLAEYFQGKRKDFTLILDLQGTDFQKRVWTELQLLTFGKTRSYLEQARILGDVKAIRAVASANGRNPIAVIVPCHRIIGSNGSLTGYASGLWRKKWLIEHENPPAQTSLF